MSRRRLPAPPLVLRSVFCRVREGTPQSVRLLSLAQFLDARGLLTDGGGLSLAAGLRGRGGVLSLTTQDVRASAHGLARDLLKEESPARWETLADDYYRRFDRGKPRRPTRLQRLMMAWSADLGPLGLLEACVNHPRLWGDLEQALTLPAQEGAEARLLATVLEVRRIGDWAPWLRHFQEEESARGELLELLPLLPHPSEEERLQWLCEQPGLACEGRLLASRRARGLPPILMPEPLRAAASTLLASTPAAVDARWLAALRGYRWPANEVAALRASLHPGDPVHRIVYGPRPGRLWLAELLTSLEAPV